MAARLWVIVGCLLMPVLMVGTKVSAMSNCDTKSAICTFNARLQGTILFQEKHGFGCSSFGDDEGLHVQIDLQGFDPQDGITSHNFRIKSYAGLLPNCTGMGPDYGQGLRGADLGTFPESEGGVVQISDVTLKNGPTVIGQQSIVGRSVAVMKGLDSRYQQTPQVLGCCIIGVANLQQLRAGTGAASSFNNPTSINNFNAPTNGFGFNADRQPPSYSPFGTSAIRRQSAATRPSPRSLANSFTNSAFRSPFNLDDKFSFFDLTATAGINNGPFGGGTSGSVFASPFESASAASPDFFNLTPRQGGSFPSTTSTSNKLLNANAPGGNNAYSGGTNAYPGGTNAYPGGTNAYPGGTNAYPGGTNAYPGGTNAYPGGTNAYPGDNTADNKTPSQLNSQGQGQANPQQNTISADNREQNPYNQKQLPSGPNQSPQKPKPLPRVPNQYPNNLKQLPSSPNKYPDQYRGGTQPLAAGNQILEGFSSFPAQTSLFTGTLGDTGSQGSSQSRAQLGDFFFQGQDKNPAADLLETGLFGSRDYGEGNGNYNPYQEFLGVEGGTQPALTPDTSQPYYGDGNNDYYGDDYYDDNYSSNDYGPGTYSRTDDNNPNPGADSGDYSNYSNGDYDDGADYPTDSGYDDRVPSDSAPAYDTGGRYRDDSYRPSQGGAEGRSDNEAALYDSPSAGSDGGYSPGNGYGDSRDYPVATSYGGSDSGPSPYDVEVQSQSDSAKTAFEGPSYDYDASDPSGSFPSDDANGDPARERTQGYNPPVDGGSDSREVTYHDTPSTQIRTSGKPVHPGIRTPLPGNDVYNDYSDYDTAPSGAGTGLSEQPRDFLSDPTRNPSYPSSDPSTNPSFDPATNPSYPSSDPASNPFSDPATNPSYRSSDPASNPSYPSSDPATNPSYPSSDPATNPSYPSSDPATNPSYPSSDPATNPSYPSSDPATNPSYPGSGSASTPAPDEGPAPGGYSDLGPYVYEGGFVAGISAVDSPDSPTGPSGPYTSAGSGAPSGPGSVNSEPSYAIRSSSAAAYDTPQPVELPPRLQQR